MPRFTKRARVIRRLEKVLSYRSKAAHLRALLNEQDDIEDDVDLMLQVQLESVRSKRYFSPRGSYRKRRYDKFEEVLGGTNKTNDVEFLFHYRMTRPAFWEVVAAIKDHPVFKTNRGRNKQAPPAHQLLVLLKYLGMSGNGSSNISIADHFGGIGHGTVRLYKRRAIKAVLSLAEEVITWPNEEERKEIAARIKDEFHFPHCVGVIDGTLLPLEFKPSLFGDAYHTRKQNYCVHMLIVSDDQGRVRYYIAGWPGSVHDNRVWTLCDLHKNAGEYFSGLEYLLGDSAFRPSPVMIPAFKKVAGHGLPREHELFNTFLAKPRVVSEHTNGMLKGRFQQLKNMRTRILNKASLLRILNYVKVCVILHNLLIAHPIPKEEYENDLADDSDEDSMTEDYGLNTVIPFVESDPERRAQLLDYLIDNYTGI